VTSIGTEPDLCQRLTDLLMGSGDGSRDTQLIEGHLQHGFESRGPSGETVEQGRLTSNPAATSTTKIDLKTLEKPCYGNATVSRSSGRLVSTRMRRTADMRTYGCDW
jgi:hypothetical protein